MDIHEQDFLPSMDATIPSYFHYQQQAVVAHERKPIAAAAANHHSSASSLLGVRKPPTKLSRRSAIDLPVPPKVYRVEPRGFRQLVQRLTGSTTTTTTTIQPPPPTTTVASSNNSLRLRDAAPAPLHLNLNQKRTVTSFDGFSVAGGGNEYSTPFSKSPVQVVEGGQISPMGGLFSPSLFSAYMAWSSHPVLSPGTMASVDESTAL